MQSEHSNVPQQEAPQVNNESNRSERWKEIDNDFIGLGGDTVTKIEEIENSLQDCLENAHDIFAKYLTGENRKKFQRLMSKCTAFYVDTKGNRQTHKQRADENAKKRGKRPTSAGSKNKSNDAAKTQDLVALEQELEKTKKRAEKAEKLAKEQGQLRDESLHKEMRMREAVTGRKAKEKEYRLAIKELLEANKSLQKQLDMVAEEKRKDMFGCVLQHGITKESKELSEMHENVARERAKKRLRLQLGDDYDEQVIDNRLRRTRATTAIEA